MIGEKFGKLTVLSFEYDKKYKTCIMKYYKCQCDCGKITIKSAQNLKVSKGCGCLKSPDFVGKTINGLSVIRLLPERKFGRKQYECICNNGHKFIRTSHNLIHKTGLICKDCCVLSDDKNIIPYGFLNRFKNDAKKRGIEFNITETDILKILNKQNNKCPYTGISLSFGIDASNKNCERNASIDRIDRNKSYDINNIQIVHKVINMMKYTIPDSEFINIIAIISNIKFGTNISTHDIPKTCLKR